MLSVLTFQPLIVIYRRSNFVFNIGQEHQFIGHCLIPLDLWCSYCLLRWIEIEMVSNYQGYTDRTVHKKILYQIKCRVRDIFRLLANCFLLICSDLALLIYVTPFADIQRSNWIESRHRVHRVLTYSYLTPLLFT